MSPQIFFERLSKIDTQLDLEASEQFFEGNEYVCFVSDFASNSYAFQITVNDSSDCEKISLASEKPDENAFKECIKSVIKVYAPEDDAENIIASLYPYEENSSMYQYFETQWHSYSASGENGFVFFSVSSKKLAPQSEVELSLKPNDKVDF